MLISQKFIALKKADPTSPGLDADEQKLVECAYRDEIGPKRKAVRILGQIAFNANNKGNPVLKQAADDEKLKLNEEI